MPFYCFRNLYCGSSRFSSQVSVLFRQGGSLYIITHEFLPADQTLNSIRPLLVIPKTDVPLIPHPRNVSPVTVVVHRSYSWVGFPLAACTRVSPQDRGFHIRFWSITCSAASEVHHVFSNEALTLNYGRYPSLKAFGFRSLFDSSDHECERGFLRHGTEVFPR